jgi:plasmid stability protein
MSKMIQLRNVPDGLHRRLKARAAAAHKSLSDYLIDEIERVAELPTFEELRERVASRAQVPGIDTAAAVRRERDGR